MIDPLEAKTLIVGSALAAGPQHLGTAWTFTADTDLTLRQVFMPSIGGDQALTTDPGFQFPAPLVATVDFFLMSQLSLIWADLAFPVPKGSTLYWRVQTDLLDLPNAILLIFS